MDADVNRKLQLARLLMDEDRWSVEKEERLAGIENAKNEHNILKKMLGGNAPSAGETPLQ